MYKNADENPNKFFCKMGIDEKMKARKIEEKHSIPS